MITHDHNTAETRIIGPSDMSLESPPLVRLSAFLVSLSQSG